MKKTLLVTIDFWPGLGGVSSYYFNLCKGLEKDKIIVLTNKTPVGQSAAKDSFGFKVVRRNLLTNIWRPKWLGMFGHIYSLIKSEKVEVIWAGEVLPTGIAVYFLARWLKRPYVVSCHGMDILQARLVGRKMKIAGQILKMASYVTVNSQYTAQLARQMGVEAEKIRVIYPGVDLGTEVDNFKLADELTAKYNLRGKKIIFSIGRLVARKGFDQVIRAMEQITKRVPEAVYVIAGEGEDKQRLERLARGRRNIIFLGKINEEEKWAWFKRCNFFIMPAREEKGDIEGFGIVYLEAALAGKPSVAGRSGGASEAVRDGQTGLSVDEEKVEAISQAALKLLEDEKLALELGRAGRQRVIDEFSWQKSARQMSRILS